MTFENESWEAKITRWEITQTHRIIEALACGDTYVTKFGTMYGWTATVDILVQDDITDDELFTGRTGTATFNVNANDNLEGEAHITGVRTSIAVDGPVLATVTLLGQGELSATAS